MPVPAKKGEGQVEIKRQIKGTVIEKRGGTYPVNGKDEPDAWRVQEEANDHGINSTVVKAEQNDDMAMVITRSCTKTNCVDDVVIHHFTSLYQKQAMDYFKKDLKRMENNLNPFYFDDINNPFMPDGTPILTPQGTVELLSYIINRKVYAIRDATSKSMRRGQLKIMNKDWREEPEILMEQEEVEDVNNSIKGNSRPVEKKELEKRAEPKKQVKRIDFPSPTGDLNPKQSTIEVKKGTIESDGKTLEITESYGGKPGGLVKPSAKLNESEAEALTSAHRKLEGEGLIETIEKDDDINSIKTSKPHKETILGPNSTQAEIEQAAEEIRQEMIAENSDERLQFLKQIPYNDFTPSQQEEFHKLDKKARETGLKEAADNLKSNPHLPDYEPPKETKEKVIRKPKGKGRTRGPGKR